MKSLVQRDSKCENINSTFILMLILCGLHLWHQLKQEKNTCVKSQLVQTSAMTEVRLFLSYLLPPRPGSEEAAEAMTDKAILG